MPLLFLFLDGVGLGEARASNPLAASTLSGFRAFAADQSWTSATDRVVEANHLFRPIDANLGIDGLPQSGTGQAALFSGRNAPRIAGRHFGPYPHSATKEMLTRDNLFTRLQREAGLARSELAFANAYPERFFSYARSRSRWTVTTFCCRAAAVRLRREHDLGAGDALPADITGRRWRDHIDEDLPVRSPEERADELLRIARSHEITLFEYYLTDKAGHGRHPDPHAIVETVDRFLLALHDGRDEELSIVITSDHGNLERLDLKTHTRNPVPLAVVGPAASALTDCADLTDVTPALVHWAASRDGVITRNGRRS